MFQNGAGLAMANTNANANNSSSSSYSNDAFSGGTLKHQAQTVIQANQQRLPDKKLQELRAFALEYVKQIVAKANELAQERARQQWPNRNSRDAPAATAATSELEAEGSLADWQLDRRLAREAAVQINKRFQLEDHVHQQQQQPAGAGHFQQSQQQQQQQQPKRPKEAAAVNWRQADLSEDDHDIYARLAGRENEAPDTSAAAGATPNSTGKGRDKRRFHQRLNWHLLVSCFSNCLPHNLTTAMPSSASRGSLSAV